ncbi:TPA: hypothetical protein ACSHS0_000325, partial [Legionella pneumophila]
KVMNLLLVLLLCIINSSVLATSQSEHDKKIIYCPEQVECQNDKCVGIGKDKEYFKHPYISSESFQEGTYYFTGASYNTQIEPYGPSIYTRCGYIKNYGPFKNDISLVLKNGSNFEPLIENWTKWQSGPGKVKACAADSSNICPLIEKREIFLDSRFRQKNNKEEYEQYPRRVLIELATESGNSINYSYSDDNLIPMNYEKTIDACGVNKQCKIYARISGVDRFGQVGALMFLGSITITTGEIMRIVSITPSDNNSSLVMATNSPMNNTIIFQSKN